MPFDNFKEYVSTHDSEVKVAAALSLVALAAGTRGLASGAKLSAVVETAGPKIANTVDGAALARATEGTAAGARANHVLDALSSAERRQIPMLLRKPGSEIYEPAAPVRPIPALLDSNFPRFGGNSASTLGTSEGSRRPQVAALLRDRNAPIESQEALAPTRKIAWLLQSH